MKKLGLLILSVLVLISASSCNSIIDKATVSLSDNLETVTVTLMFATNIQEELAGTWAVQDYGNVFLNPYSPTAPFEAGFSLNTSILNDQQYVTITPTEVLPNGLPIGVGYALAEVQMDKPISSQYDLYAYLDVKQLSWLGMAAIFNFVNDKNFPAGLSVTQTLENDSAGNPEIIANAFGPVVNADGSLKQAGGLAVFANVRELIASGLTPMKSMVIHPTLPATYTKLK